MNRLIASTIISFIIVFLSCDSPVEAPIELISHTIITSVPSASGVYYMDESIWLVGDDAIDLFRLNNELQIQEQYQISALSNKIEGRVIKSIKADFESMDFFDSLILMLGSGSKKDSRDTAVLFHVNAKKLIKRANFRSLYNYLMEIGDIDTTISINIEGLASDKEYFYLLHRGNIDGNNNVYRIPKNELLNYMNTQELPQVECFKYQLPKIEEYLSGFSGACVSPDGKYLLITSSVEATTDVYHDGEVLGSFIGYIPLEGDKPMSELKAWPIKHKGSILKTKLESLSVINQDEEKFELICVSDNDNGESGVYYINLNIKGY